MSLILTLNSEAKSFIPQFSFLGLFGKDFSSFLHLDLIAGLLKELEVVTNRPSSVVQSHTIPSQTQTLILVIPFLVRKKTPQTWLLLEWLLSRWLHLGLLLLTFSICKTTLGETECSCNPYFLLTGCLSIQLFYSPTFY